MRTLHQAALSLASAALYACAWHAPGGWIAGWLWPIPVLLVVLRTRPLPAVAWGFVSWAVGSLAWWPVERSVLPLSAFLLAHAALALPFCLSIPVLQFQARRSGTWAPYGFAASFTLLSALQVTLNPHGTWGLLVYSQTWGPMLQCLAWGGPYLLLLLMLAFPAALTLALTTRDRASWWSAGATAGLGAVLILAGGFRLASLRNAAEVKVGLYANDRTVGAFRATQAAEALPVVDLQARQATRLAQDGAQLVVLPEKLVGVTPGDEAEVDARFAKAAPGAVLVAGLNGTGRTPKLNMARIYFHGKPAGTLLKRHLVPRWEDGYTAGTRPLACGALGTRLGVAICKDFDFLDTSKDLARDGARLVAAPAWDFEGTEAIHARMARFRAIEGGFALARCAQEGRLDLWDDRGRSLGSTATRGGEAHLLASVPLGSGTTAYARWGEWALVLSAGLLLATFLVRRR